MNSWGYHTGETVEVNGSASGIPAVISGMPPGLLQPPRSLGDGRRVVQGRRQLVVRVVRGPDRDAVEHDVVILELLRPTFDLDVIGAGVPRLSTKIK